METFILLFVPSTASNHRGRLCDSFLPLPILDWRTFSRRITARWWRQWAKSQVWTNQNSRNRWCLIVRRTKWILDPTRALTSASRGKFWTADWKAVAADLNPSPKMACCGCWWLGWWGFNNFSYDSDMVPPWFHHVSPMISLVFLWVPGSFPAGSPRFPFQILRLGKIFRFCHL